MKLLFIGGCGRSGSSMLQDLLTRHPDVVGGPEFNFTQQLMELHAGMGSPYFASRNEAFYTKAELDDRFRTFYHSFFEHLVAAHPEALWCSEKTPSNINVLPQLLALFPEARFLFVLRDGRDVVASYKEVLKRAEGKLDRAGYGTKRLARIWKSALDTRDQLSEADRQRVLTVRYEEFVNHPEEGIDQILQFLDLEKPELSLLELKQEGHAVHMDGIFHSKEMMSTAPHAGKIGSWKKRLSLFDRFQANLWMAYHLKKAGYPVSVGFTWLDRMLASRTENTSS